jgi:hypothetical protein
VQDGTEVGQGLGNIRAVATRLGLLQRPVHDNRGTKGIDLGNQ